MPIPNTPADADRLLQLLQLYSHIAAQLAEDPRTPYSQIGESSHPPVSATSVSNCVASLEARFGEVLLERRPRSSDKQLTVAGRALADRAAVALDAWRRLHESLSGGARITLVASHFLQVAVLPGVISEFRRRHPEEAAVKLVIQDVRDQEELLTQLRSGETDLAVQWLVPGRRDLLNSVAFETLAEVDVVVVTHPSHRLAAEFSTDPSVPIELGSLGVQQFYHIRQPDQVLMDLVPSVTGEGGGRVQVEHYDSVLRFVRLGIDNAVGLVPGLYQELDRYRTAGELFYGPVADTQKLAIVALVRRGGVEQLSAAQQKLYAVLRAHLASLPTARWWDSVPVPAKFALGPLAFRGLTHAYFVSRHAAGLNTPYWYSAEIVWGTGPGKDCVGRLVDNSIGSGDNEYRVQAHTEFAGSGDGILYLVGHKRAGAVLDPFVATFTTTVFAEARTGKAKGPLLGLVGTWTGRDHGLVPTTAPMILSREKLSLQALLSFRADPANNLLLYGYEFADRYSDELDSARP